MGPDRPGKEEERVSAPHNHIRPHALNMPWLLTSQGGGVTPPLSFLAAGRQGSCQWADWVFFLPVGGQHSSWLMPDLLEGTFFFSGFFNKGLVKKCLCIFIYFAHLFGEWVRVLWTPYSFTWGGGQNLRAPFSNMSPLTPPQLGGDTLGQGCG